MADLSPAAQAVFYAAEAAKIDPDWWPDGAPQVAAAALRAAAVHIDDASDGLECQDILRQIADELENHNG